MAAEHESFCSVTVRRSSRSRVFTQHEISKLHYDVTSKDYQLRGVSARNKFIQLDVRLDAPWHVQITS